MLLVSAEIARDTDLRNINKTQHKLVEKIVKMKLRIVKH
jgi:hypothetical protein